MALLPLGLSQDVGAVFFFLFLNGDIPPPTSTLWPLSGITVGGRKHLPSENKAAVAALRASVCPSIHPDCLGRGRRAVLQLLFSLYHIYLNTSDVKGHWTRLCTCTFLSPPPPFVIFFWLYLLLLSNNSEPLSRQVFSTLDWSFFSFQEFSFRSPQQFSNSNLPWNQGVIFHLLKRNIVSTPARGSTQKQFKLCWCQGSGYFQLAGYPEKFL